MQRYGSGLPVFVPSGPMKAWITQCTLGSYSGTFTDSFQYPPNRTLLNKVQFPSVTAGNHETSKSDNSRSVPAEVWP